VTAILFSREGAAVTVAGRRQDPPVETVAAIEGLGVRDHAVVVPEVLGITAVSITGSNGVSGIIWSPICN
jgi:hypothetical protein